MPRPYISVSQQRYITDRAHSRCEYCQSWMEYAVQSFVFEHIIPVILGGKTILENLALACGGCNGHKYTKIEAIDPLTGETVPLYHPRQQRWIDHFGWSEDYLEIIGLTSVGRSTIDALKMNRPGVVNMRRLLRLAGKHPANDHAQ